MLHFKDDHADKYKGHQVKPALEVNQTWSFNCEDVRIIVTKQQYYEEGNASTYPREENIVVKADPNANPQYEPLYMYAVLKATISGQGTFWFLGHHNNPAHANYPKHAVLDLNGDGKAETTVPLYRWKWGNLNFSWSYTDPDWQSHNDDKNNDNQADWPHENPWTKVTFIQSGINLWQLLNGVRVNQGLKLGTRRYKVEVTCGTQVVRSPDENDTDGYGPKEMVRRVVSMYAFNTKYLRWCSTFLRINTIYASVYKQVDRYIGGDCADVAVIAYRKMKRGNDEETSRNEGLSSHEDWWADALAKENDPELSTVNEPRAGDLVLIDIHNPPDGVFDHTTVFAGNMDDPLNDPNNTKVFPKDRMMNINFGTGVRIVPPSEYGAYAFIWATYEHFPSHYLNPTNHRIRHLSGVTEYTHP